MTSGRIGGIYILLLLGLVVSMLASIVLGARTLTTGITLEQLVAVLSVSTPTENPDALVMRARIPRTLLACGVGLALPLSGAVIQGLTRNPLADPGLLGITAGAALAVVTVATLHPSASTALTGVVGWAAALVTALAVYLSAGRSPTSLLLIGAAFTAGCSSVITGMIITSRGSLEVYRQWMVGSVTRATTAQALLLIVVSLSALVVFYGLARSLNLLAMGEELATTAGVNITATVSVGIVLIALLCATAVTFAGPIAFLGLLVPHAVRALIGTDYRHILCLTAVLGPLVVLLADILGRVVAPPTEIPVGITTAVLGATVLIVLVRRS